MVRARIINHFLSFLHCFSPLSSLSIQSLALSLQSLAGSNKNVLGQEHVGEGKCRNVTLDAVNGRVCVQMLTQ